MKIYPIIKILLLSCFIFTCAGKQVVTYSPVSPENYKNYSWEKKIDFFNSFDNKTKQFPVQAIYTTALLDPVPAVTIAALKSFPEIYAVDFKQTFYSMIKSKNPVIRWQVCEKISLVPRDEDIPVIISMYRDRDWMVRECAFRNIRLYSSEKQTRKFFFPTISHLYEKNAQVLRQICKTLKWYNDPRAYPFMYKRSYVVDTSSEMIVIIQELSEIKNSTIKSRIWYISKNHSDYFVRKEAERIYQSMR